MANPSTYPSDGRITSLQNYTATLAGTELLQLVAPGNATAGVNYNITVTQMLSGVFSVLPAQPANVVLAGPTSGAGTATPAFRTLVLADIPGGTSGFPLVGNNATSAPSYQLLGLPGGGIGTTSLSAAGVVLANGTNAFSVVAATTAGLVLTSQGSTSPPTWNATSGGTVFSVATGTGLIGGPVTGVGTVSLSVPGTVPNGGIGTTALPLDGVVLGNSTSALTVAPATTAGYPFVSNGSTSAPSFQVLNLAAGTFVTGVLPLANGGSGTSGLPLDGVVLGNSPGLKVAPATTAGYPLVSNGSASAPSFQALGAPGVSLTATSNVLAASVALNNTTTYFTGPSVAQGTTGTWYVSGGITISNGTSTAQGFLIKLWDGSTVIDSGVSYVNAAGQAQKASFSGFIVNPAGNLNIAVQAALGTATLQTSLSGNAHDSTITAVRIA